MGSKTEAIKREQEIAEQARPFILKQLQEGREPLEISTLVAERWDVDQRLSYRWAQYISDDYHQKRRRYVFLGLAMLWPGALLAAGGAVLSVLDVTFIPFVPWLAGLVSGLPLVGAGSVVIHRAGRLVRLSV
jgi:hypothetical protein